MKIRRPLGVTAFGVNAIVYPPGAEGILHYHDLQDELYFVHAGAARFEVDEEVREPGRVASESFVHDSEEGVDAGEDDLVLLIVGGKDGYVTRDGHHVNPDDAERRRRPAARSCWP